MTSVIESGWTVWVLPRNEAPFGNHIGASADGIFLLNPVVRHSFREANKVADILAKQGAKLTLSNHVQFLLTPPYVIKQQLLDDKELLLVN